MKKSLKSLLIRRWILWHILRAVQNLRTKYAGETKNTYGGFGDSGFLKKAPEKTLQDETSYIIGDKVKHRKFGIGTVVSAQQMGKDCLVVVDFESVGQKKMMAAYANFERVE